MKARWLSPTCRTELPLLEILVSILVRLKSFGWELFLSVKLALALAMMINSLTYAL